MAHKYLVDLTSEEQGYLFDVVRKGKTTARRVARAHVLLRAATGAVDEEIAETLHLGLVCANIHADPGGLATVVALTCERQSPSVKCATG